MLTHRARMGAVAKGIENGLFALLNAETELGDVRSLAVALVEEHKGEFKVRHGKLTLGALQKTARHTGLERVRGGGID